MLSRLLGIRIFDLEASGACNLACPFCPREQLPPTGHMSQETFSAFLERVPLTSADTVSFIGVGEPTLNRLLPDFIFQAKARYPGVRTWLTTNGTTLNERVASRLLGAGLDTIDLSFNGLEKEDYERLMKGASFEKVLANINCTLQEIQRSGRRARLQINYIVTRENADQEEVFQAFWHARGVHHFRPQVMHDRSGLTHVDGMTPLDLPGLRQHACAKFEVMPVITWQGDVLYCSHDISRSHMIGNIREHTWEELEQRRQEIVRDQKWPAMCQGCTDPYRHDLREKLDVAIRGEIQEKVGHGLHTLGRYALKLIGA